MPSPERELGLGVAHDGMNDPTGVLLEIHGLQDQVRSVSALRPRHFDEVPGFSFVVERVRVVHLAQLAFEGLPVMGDRTICSLLVLLLCL